jgi:hypothetical protein
MFIGYFYISPTADTTNNHCVLPTIEPPTPALVISSQVEIATATYHRYANDEKPAILNVLDHCKNFMQHLEGI